MISLAIFLMLYVRLEPQEVSIKNAKSLIAEMSSPELELNTYRGVEGELLYRFPLANNRSYLN